MQNLYKFMDTWTVVDVDRITQSVNTEMQGHVTLKKSSFN